MSVLVRVWEMVEKAVFREEGGRQPTNRDLAGRPRRQGYGVFFKVFLFHRRDWPWDFPILYLFTIALWAKC